LISQRIAKLLATFSTIGKTETAIFQFDFDLSALDARELR
jgi:hypothetical protein